jgi:GNAT superfamily N-acetyltransferase
MPDFDFRRVETRDFDFCWPIYRDALRPLSTGVFQWNDAQHQAIVREALGDEGASILVSDGDAGWLLASETRFTIHLAHFYLLPEKRRHGLGSRFLIWMSERARRKEKEFTLDVVKNNPALALYQRLGFKPVKTTAYVITMRL